MTRLTPEWPTSLLPLKDIERDWQTLHRGLQSVILKLWSDLWVAIFTTLLSMFEFCFTAVTFTQYSIISSMLRASWTQGKEGYKVFLHYVFFFLGRWSFWQASLSGLFIIPGGALCQVCWMWTLTFCPLPSGKTQAVVLHYCLTSIM